MKKIFSVIVAFAIILAATPVFANYDITLSAATQNCGRGEQVTVSIDISDYSTACGGSFEVVYDSSILSVVSASKGEAFSNINTTVNKNFSPESVKVIWFGTTNPGGGEVVSIVFDAIAPGQSEIQIKNVKLSDINANSLGYSVCNGAVNVFDEIEIIGFRNPADVDVWSADDCAGAVAVFASYDNSKICRNVSAITVDLNKGINNLKNPDFDYDGSEKVKVFIWKNAESVKPLCKPLIIGL